MANYSPRYYSTNISRQLNLSDTQVQTLWRIAHNKLDNNANTSKSLINRELVAANRRGNPTGLTEEGQRVYQSLFGTTFVNSIDPAEHRLTSIFARYNPRINDMKFKSPPLKDILSGSWQNIVVLNGFDALVVGSGVLTNEYQLTTLDNFNRFEVPDKLEVAENAS